MARSGKNFSIIILFFIAVPVFSQKLYFIDDKENWNIAIADFPVTGNSKDIFYIEKYLPGLFYGDLSSCKLHTLSSDEISFLRKYYVQKKLEEEEKKLSSYLKEYDLAYFHDTSKRRDIDRNIQNAKKAIKQLNKYNPADIKIKPVKDIVFTKENNTGQALTFERLDIDRYSLNNNFDYILYGSARIIENIIVVEIKLYSFLEKKDIYSTSVTSEAASVLTSMDNVIADLTTIFLGVNWSKLSVELDNSSADIYLNEEFLGTGSVKNIIVTPGNHTVTITGSGIEEKIISVYLEEKKQNIVNAETVSQENKITAINSLPQGANIYFDSVWKGTTPFLLNGESGELILRKDGFRDTRLVLEDISENSVEVMMSPDIFNKEDYIAKKRKNFYSSLSLFIISIPVPFFLYAMTVDYDDSFRSAVASNSNSSEISRLKKNRNMTRYGYYGSLFLTAGLLINTLFQLNDYIKAGDVLYAE